MNCLHGIDARFCARCHRQASHGGVGNTTLEEILQFLNDEQIRATYGAVADVLGVSARSLTMRLGAKRPEASWIVGAENGLPVDYSQAEWHPELLGRGDMITNGRTLILRMTAWKQSRS